MPESFSQRRPDPVSPAPQPIDHHATPDATEPLQAEENLRQVLADTHCLLWHGEGMQNEDGPQHTLEVWNDELAQRIFPLEIPAGTTYSNRWQSSIAGEDRERIRRQRLQALREEPAYTEHEFLCRGRNGAIRWFREYLRTEPVEPRRWKMAGICLDITAYKQAERRNAMFEALGDRLNQAATPEAIARITLEAADTLFGWDACWLQLRDQGRPPRIRMVVLTDTIDGRRVDVPTQAEYIEPSPLALLAMRTGSRLITAHRHDFPAVHTFGDHQRTSECIMVVPLRLGDQIIGAMSIQSYQQNAYTEEDLRVFQALADYCAGALARTQAKECQSSLEKQLRAVQRLDAVGKLAGGVAHDFNNMLAVINGYSELLLEAIPPIHPWWTSVREIKSAGERAARLTRQLLAFSRKQLLELKSLHLRDVLVGLNGMLRQLVGEHVELSVTSAPDLWTIRADQGQLEQAIINLALNARDAMPGGGQLRIEITNCSLEAHSPEVRSLVHQPNALPGDYVAFRISDTGHGMSREILQHIFDPFFTTKSPGQGTGLGLATVYGIVQQCGGSIAVDSAPGQGTTFTLYLPRAAEERRHSEPDAAPALTLNTSNPETILLVDDELMIRTLVQRVLETFGYRVLAASDPAEAIRLCWSHPEPIDLLLTDLVMPHMNGSELAREVLKRHPNARVAYMSGYANDVIGRQGLLDDQTTFIYKPFTPTHLASKVREVLDRRYSVHRSRGRILIIDDDADGRESLCELLADSGYEVLAAAHGAEGLELLRAQKRPDLILLDLIMPGMNGWVFSLELQKHDDLADIPIVVISGTYDTQPVAGFLNAAGHLTKPIDVEQLLALVQRICDAGPPGPGDHAGSGDHAEDESDDSGNA